MLLALPLPGTLGAMGLGFEELLGMMTVSALGLLLPPLLFLFMIMFDTEKTDKQTELYTLRAPDSD